MKKSALLSILYSLVFASTITSIRAQDFAGEPDAYEESDPRLVIPQDGQVLEGFGRAPNVELNPDSIRALVWNVHKASFPGWGHDFARYAPNVDLALLQEAYLNPSMHGALDRDRGHFWDMAVSFFNHWDAPGYAAGVATGSSAQPLDHYYLRSAPREPIGRVPKMMLFSRFQVRHSAEPLLVVNVHGINFVRTRSYLKQIGQIETQIARHRGPVLLGGDFNTWTPGRTGGLLSAMKRLGMREVKFQSGLQVRNFMGWPLDHAFVRGLSVRRARVEGNCYTSDHKPLQLELALSSN